MQNAWSKTSKRRETINAEMTFKGESNGFARDSLSGDIRRMAATGPGAAPGTLGTALAHTLPSAPGGAHPGVPRHSSPGAAGPSGRAGLGRARRRRRRCRSDAPRPRPVAVAGPGPEALSMGEARARAGGTSPPLLWFKLPQSFK